jgi:M6 family metalloprotease-like protein
MKIKLYFVFTFIVTSFLLQQVYAVPAVPWPVEIRQPDGTKVTVRIRGDEKAHWMESPDGYTLMYDSKKTVVYAELDPEGNMRPSTMKYGYGEASLRSSTGEPIQKGLRYSPSQVYMLKQIWEVASRQSTPQPAPAATAEKKALLILMDFPDRPFSKTKADFEALVNQVGYNTDGAEGSVKDFYRENSYGKLELNTTVAGPYTADSSAAFYANGKSQILATEAVTRAAAELNLQDYADNGALETFHIIFAGHGAETGLPGSQYIWSHMWAIWPSIIRDGVRVSVFSCSPELRNASGTDLTRIGVICHELGHVFGSPDYYDSDYAENGEYPGTGCWDLMADGSWNNSGITPAHINMFQKMCYGWVTPTELTSYTMVDSMPNSAQNAVAYTYTANANGEMYLLENRQKTGFDRAVPGHGLLIWHVHQAALGGNGSNTGHPQNLYPVVASSSTAIPNSIPDSYGSVNSTGTPFPGTSGKTDFTDMTVPQAFSWKNLQGIGKPVTNISERDGKISFVFMQSGPLPVANLSASVTPDTVKLSWSKPPSLATLQNYIIYKDNQQIATTSATSYWDSDIEPETTYSYCVVAGYDDGSSEPACVEVVTGRKFNPNPAKNLELTATGTDGKDVQLTWQKPDAHTGKNLQLHGTSSNSAYSLGANDWVYAVRFTPENLNTATGLKLTKVNFYAPNSVKTNMVDFTVKIYKGGNGSSPGGDAILSQTIGSFSSGRNEIALENPVVLDIYQDLWIGILVHKKVEGDIFVLSFDRGPNHIGQGDMLCINGIWATGKSLISGFNANWLLSGVLEPIDVTGYQILRNNRDIATIDDPNTLTYTDVNPDKGEYEYCVKALHSTQKSDPVCDDITIGENTGIEPVADLVYLYGKQNKIYVVAGSANPIRQINVYDSQGRLLYTESNIYSSSHVVTLNTISPGVYIVRLITGQGVRSLKLLMGE